VVTSGSVLASRVERLKVRRGLYRRRAGSQAARPVRV